MLNEGPSTFAWETEMHIVKSGVVLNIQCQKIINSHPSPPQRKVSKPRLQIYFPDKGV